jgi:plastocyanin
VSANIPVGATAFESPFMTGATASFSQTFTVPGNYRYLCTLHASAADANAATQGSTMVGEFTVVAGTTVPPTGVPTV